jgi:hypothetical protein
VLQLVEIPDEDAMAIPKKSASAIQMPSVDDLVRELIDEPEKWLDTRNDQLGGAKPRELMGTPKEPVLRNLLEAIKHGSFS